MENNLLVYFKNWKQVIYTVISLSYYFLNILWVSKKYIRNKSLLFDN